MRAERYSVLFGLTMSYFPAKPSHVDTRYALQTVGCSCTVGGGEHPRGHHAAARAAGRQDATGRHATRGPGAARGRSSDYQGLRTSSGSA